MSGPTTRSQSAGCFSAAVARPLAPRRAGPATCGAQPGARAPRDLSLLCQRRQRGPFLPGDQEDGLWPRQDVGVGCPRPRARKPRGTSPEAVAAVGGAWGGAAHGAGQLWPRASHPAGHASSWLRGGGGSAGRGAPKARAQTWQLPPQCPWPSVRPCASPASGRETLRGARPSAEEKPLPGSVAAIPASPTRPRLRGTGAEWQGRLGRTVFAGPHGAGGSGAPVGAAPAARLRPVLSLLPTSFPAGTVRAEGGTGCKGPLPPLPPSPPSLPSLPTPLPPPSSPLHPVFLLHLSFLLSPSVSLPHPQGHSLRKICIF